MFEVFYLFVIIIIIFSYYDCFFSSEVRNVVECDLGVLLVYFVILLFDVTCVQSLL